jgi:hypothetical protein
MAIMLDSGFDFFFFFMIVKPVKCQDSTMTSDSP